MGARQHKRICELEAENAKLRQVIETNEICHDSNLSVGKIHFFKGCLACIARQFDEMTREEVLAAFDDWKQNRDAGCMKRDPRPDPYLQRTLRIG